MHDWWKQAWRDTGAQPGPTTAETARIKALEREVWELRQANGIFKKASVYFAQVELDRPFRKRSRLLKPVDPIYQNVWRWLTSMPAGAYRPPAEAERAFHADQSRLDIVA